MGKDLTPFDFFPFENFSLLFKTFFGKFMCKEFMFIAASYSVANWPSKNLPGYQYQDLCADFDIHM